MVSVAQSSCDNDYGDDGDDADEDYDDDNYFFMVFDDDVLA